MSAGSCPRCHSGDYVQYTREQGKNHCQHCGYVGAVREFHQPRSIELRRSRSRVAHYPTGRELENSLTGKSARYWWQDD